MNQENFRRRKIVFFLTNALLQLSFYLGLLIFFSGQDIWFDGLIVLCLGILAVNYGTAVATLVAAVAYPHRIVQKPSAPLISRDARTAVVIPCLLSSKRGIDELVDVINRNHQASRSVPAIYVLLADHLDAEELTPEVERHDEELLQYAQEKVDTLNRLRGGGFALFLRPRIWAPTESVWMGKERKRGKIEAFNRYLLSGETGEFSLLPSNLDIFAAVEYVLTLDADTVLPPNALEGLVALLDDPRHADFAMIQPGYKPIVEEPKNWYQWVHTSPFPPLSILQGVFGRCKFVGKGIYRVKQFQAGLEDRLPSAWVLSHDVVESCLLKVGATDDVFVRESNPETFEEGCGRLHRWFRGDWQNLPWALPGWIRYRIPEFKQLRRQPLGAGEAWTVLDLVFRDLHAPALLAVILLSIASQSPFSCFGVMLSCELFWASITFISKWIRNETRKTAVDVLRVPLNTAYYFASLPTQAWLAIDAGCRSMWRMLFSKKNRLQWTASAEFRTLVSGGFRFWTLVPGIAFGALMAGTAYLSNHLLPVVLAATWLSFPALTIFLERQPLVLVTKKAGSVLRG